MEKKDRARSFLLIRAPSCPFVGNSFSRYIPSNNVGDGASGLGAGLHVVDLHELAENGADDLHSRFRAD